MRAVLNNPHRNGRMAGIEGDTFSGDLLVLLEFLRADNQF